MKLTNKRTLLSFFAILSATISTAQTVAHPRIWLDQSTSAKLRAKVASNDPTWTALKARCDLYLQGQVFWPDVQQYGDAQDIGSGYQGSGWFEPIMDLGLAYQVLKPTDPVTAKKYATKLIDVLTKMSEPSGPHFVEPLTDDGFGIRFYGAGMAMGFDFIYPELTPALKTRLVTAMNLWVSKVGTDGFETSDDHPVGNYYAGYYMAKALVAIGTEGDNAQAPTMWSSWLNDNHLKGVQPYFAKWLAGGGWPEGWDYGPLAVFNMIAPVWAAKTGKNLDLFNFQSAPFPYAHDSGQAIMEMIFPDQKTMDTHGETYDTEDNPVPSSDPEMYTKLAGILQYLGDPGAPQLHSFARNVRQINGKPPLWVDFLFWDDKAPEASITSRPLSYLATGMNMSVMRSAWTPTAVWGNILAGATIAYSGGGHEKFDKGGLTITRGSTRFLIQAHAEMDQNSTPGVGDGGAYDFPTSDDPNNPNNFYNDDFGDHDSFPNMGNATSYNVFYTKNPRRWGQYAIDPTMSKANISKFEDGYTYTYTRCSRLDENYWDKDSQSFSYVPYWTRDVLYLRPEVFVVRDRTTVYDAHIPQYMAWHFGKTPVYTAQNDNGKIDARYDVSEGSVYKGNLTSLFPISGSTKLVNLYNSGRAYRVECYPPANALSSQTWLNVLDAAPTRADSFTATRMSAADGNVVQGAFFGAEMLSKAAAQVGLFGTGPEATLGSGVIKIIVSRIGTVVAIADMKPGVLYTQTSEKSGAKFLITFTPGSGPLKVSAAGILSCKVK